MPPRRLLKDLLGAGPEQPKRQPWLEPSQAPEQVDPLQASVPSQEGPGDGVRPPAL